jgi:CheY-like chemotaxis protein
MNAVVRQHSSGPDDRSGSREERDVAQVLVVDDDHSIRDTVRLLLEDAGYSVAEAGNGVEALALLRDERASYITLLDLRMPQLDGAGLLGIVAEDPDLACRHTFILMTADIRALSPLFSSHLTRLAVPVLSKPFDIDDLFDLVERAACELTARPQLASRTAPGKRTQRHSA